MKNSRRFYDRFSFLYPLVDVFLMRQKRRMIHEINQLPPGRLLEIGVGTGSHLSQIRNHEITGIDHSPAMLRQASRNAPQDSTLIEMDALSLDFEEASFDYVVLSHVIAVVEEPENVLREAFHVLVPGGRLIILNHFTPSNGLGLADKLLRPVAELLHLRSVIRPEQLQELRRHHLVKTIPLGPFSYFKILIFQKP